MRYTGQTISLLAIATAMTIAPEVFGAPINPALPYPPNLATNVPANVDLTWTPGDSELIINGGFETGNFTGWSKVNTFGGGGGGGGSRNDTYINTNGAYVPFSGDAPHPPYAGTFSSVTDQNGPGDISLYQDVTIPATATSATLTWVHMIRNQFNTFVVTDPPQEYRVEIRRPDNSVLATAYRTEPGDPTRTDWQKQSFSLDAFRGQTVRIWFIELQWWSFFNLHLDNISVRVRDPGPYTYQVYFGNTNLLTASHLLGTTTPASWTLPQQNPNTTYFWRLVAQQGTSQFSGPTWRFTTAPAGQVDRFVWDNVPSPQPTGAPVGVRIRAVDAADNVVTNFNGTVNLSGASLAASVTGTLLDSPNPTSFATYDRSTVGYSFTPNQDLLVTGVRHFSGRKVSLWTEGGVLLGSTPVSGTPGAWHESSVTPIQLFAGRTYRVGLYSPLFETNYLRLDGTAGFAHGTLRESYEGLGDAFPTNVHGARWWLVDLVYSARTLQPAIVTPTTTGVFSNGVWSGTIAVSSSGDLLLRAEDATGHAGLSTLITFAEDRDLDGMPDEWEDLNQLDADDPTDALDDDDHDGSNNLAEYRAGTDPQSAASALRIESLQRNGSEVRIRLATVPGKTYVVESTSNVASGWQSVQENIAGGTQEVVLPNVTGSPRFFRVRLAQ